MIRLRSVWSRKPGIFKYNTLYPCNGQTFIDAKRVLLGVGVSVFSVVADWKCDLSGDRRRVGSVLHTHWRNPLRHARLFLRVLGRVHAPGTQDEGNYGPTSNRRIFKASKAV